MKLPVLYIRDNLVMHNVTLNKFFLNFPAKVNSDL